MDNGFHPIRQYLDTIEWDGKPRIDRLLVDYFGAEDNELNRAFARKFTIAAVRRVRQPGAKFDQVLVLEGPQGQGKSTALAVLAGGPENFSDADILALGTQAQIEALEGVWIYELCELEGLQKAEATKVKAFVSRSVDRGRPAYGRFREDHHRQTVFVGTTNDSRYLRDRTGNRRFWPVAVGKIDLDGLKRDRDQIWAEAAYHEAEGEHLTLPEELWSSAAVEQKNRVEEDPWLNALAAVQGQEINGVERITTARLLTHILQIPLDRQADHHGKRLGQAMRELGWNGPKSIRIGGNVGQGYERELDGSKTLPGAETM